MQGVASPSSRRKILGLVTGGSGGGCILGWLDFVDTFFGAKGVDMMKGSQQAAVIGTQLD